MTTFTKNTTAKGRTPQFCCTRLGFTLLEIIVTVIIVGSLAGIALPRYTRMVERMRASEGKQLLLVMYTAQKRYELDNGNFTTQLADLDIDFRTSEFFDTFVVSNAPVARINRKGNLYRLNIDTNATITCSNDTANWCSQLGF